MPALFIGGPNSFIGGPNTFVGGFAAAGDVNVTLTGIALTTSQGALSSAFSKTLDSQILSLSQGGLSYVFSKALVGNLINSSQGAFSYALSKTLDSQLLALSQGILTYSAAVDVNVTLTGIAMNLSQSNIGYELSKALGSALITTSQGNLTFNNILPLTGLGLSTSQGALVYGLSKTLDSQLLQLSQGVLTAAIGGDVNVTLTGIGMGLSQGSLTASITSASAGGNSTAHKKKRKPLQHRKQVEDLFGERFAELAGEIQDQLEVLPTEAIDAEIGLLLKATHYKQQLDSSNSKTSDNELKRVYDAVNATIKYLKLVKQVNDDEEAMILIIYALYG